MTALAFDPWAMLKVQAGDGPPPNPPKPPNLAPSGVAGLGGLGGLGEGPSPACEIARHAAGRAADAGWEEERPAVRPSDEAVEALAVALAARPGHRMTDPVRAMAYYRSDALRRLKLPHDDLARALLAGML